MKLVKMSCPHCGGALDVEENAKQAKCPYCNSVVVIDDEVQHIQFDNSEKAGYEFEQGRMRMQQDMVNAQIAAEQARIQARQNAERKKKKLVWWVLGWIFIFPVPLTILIARSKKLKTVWKIILIVALWGTIMIIGAMSNEDDTGESLSSAAQIHSIQTSTYTHATEYERTVNVDLLISI